MKWCKKKILYGITFFVLLTVWLTCFLRVNKTYEVGAWESYRLGETYQVMGREVTWNSMCLMTREEAMEKFQMVSKQDWLSWTEGDTEYCVIGVSIKNLTDDTISPEFFHWTIQCDSYTNGATYLTTLVNKGIVDGIQPGESRDIWIFYNVDESLRETMLNNPVRIYVSVYPERIYLEDKLL